MLENLFSLHAGLLRDKGYQRKKEKQLYRIHKILFHWWLAGRLDAYKACTMPFRFFCQNSSVCTHCSPANLKLIKPKHTQHSLTKVASSSVKSWYCQAAQQKHRVINSTTLIHCCWWFRSSKKRKGYSHIIWNNSQYSNSFSVVSLPIAKNWHLWPASLPVDM